MKNIIILIVFMTFVTIKAQIDLNSLIGLPAVTNAEIAATTSVNAGSIMYNSDTNQIVLFNGTAFENIPSGERFYVGTFQITTAGAINITGIPFQPTSVTFTTYANIETTDINDDNDAIPDADNDNTLANSHGGMRGSARTDGATIIQQVIGNGASGNSINDISRYASSSHCVGIRYGDRNGDQVGLTTAILTGFTANGFTINTDAFSDGLLVIYEAYR